MTGDRITLKMDTLEVVMALAGGNPGAVTVCSRLLTEGSEVDPENAFGGFGSLLLLDSFGIYEHRIWMLYNDVCRGNLVKTIAVLRACQLGEISISKLQHAIDNRGAGIDLDEIMGKVREKLTQFQTT